MADTDEATVDTRGQISVPLEGQEYVLRPSFEAIQAIEKALGRSHEQLAMDATRMRLSYDDMGVVCAEMMRAHGKACPDDPLASSYRGARAEKLAGLIYEAGKQRIAGRVAVVLVAALSGGYTATGEAKAGTPTSEEAIPAAD